MSQETTKSEFEDFLRGVFAPPSHKKWRYVYLCIKDKGWAGFKFMNGETFLLDDNGVGIPVRVWRENDAWMMEELETT